MLFLVLYYEPSIKERGMAQLVACLLWEQEVPSSSLGAPTEEVPGVTTCP